MDRTYTIATNDNNTTSTETDCYMVYVVDDSLAIEHIEQLQQEGTNTLARRIGAQKALKQLIQAFQRTTIRTSEMFEELTLLLREVKSQARLLIDELKRRPFISSLTFAHGYSNVIMHRRAGLSKSGWITRKARKKLKNRLSGRLYHKI